MSGDADDDADAVPTADDNGNDYDIDESGAAGKAGLKGMTQDRFGRVYLGDVILSVDNKEVNSLDDIFHVLESYKIGDTVSLKYRRGDKTQVTKVKLQSL